MEVTMTITGENNGSQWYMGVSFTAVFEDGQKIEATYTGSGGPFYYVVKFDILPKIMKDFGLSRLKATELVNLGLRSCGLSELPVSNTVKVC
jgi:hypothetical protein